MNNKVLVCITGKNPKNFLKRLIKNNIDFKNLKMINYKTMSFIVSYQDYINLLEYKTIYQIYAKRYYGFIKIKYNIKSNLSLFIGFFISILLLYIVSNMIFEIEVVHNDKKIRDILYDELELYKIEKYHLIPSYKKREQIKKAILNDNKETIEWLEIKRVGSRLEIKVTERRRNNKNIDESNRHIVAKKSGFILKIVANKGVVLKQINDYVLKDEIIISGDIIKDETVKGQVTAKGRVYAEIWYKVSVNYPLYYEEVLYLNETKNNIVISFINKNIKLRKNYETSFLEKKKLLVKEKLFPFNIYVEKQRKTKVTKQKLTKEEAIKKAIILAEEKIKSKLDKEEYIISKNTLSFSVNNSRIEVDMFFKVCEDITSYKNVDLIEIINE